MFVSWRKILRRIWGMPYKTHCHLLPILSRCLHVEDEIGSRSLNFINASIRNHPSLVHAVTNYGIHHGRYSSFLGHNVLFCVRRCNFSVLDMCSCNVNIKFFVYNYMNTSIDDSQLPIAGFVSELVIRDHLLELSGKVNFSRDELEQLVEVVCTYQILLILCTFLYDFNNKYT